MDLHHSMSIQISCYLSVGLSLNDPIYFCVLLSSLVWCNTFIAYLKNDVMENSYLRTCSSENAEVTIS